MTVSNSTPLIYLSKLSHLRLLRELFGEVRVTSLVLGEVLRGKKFGFGDAGVVERAEQEGWIKRVELSDEREQKLLKLRDSFPQLSRADASAIVLAKELEDRVCLDDAIAVKAAETVGVDHIGTMGIILKAVKDGHIERKRAREMVLSLPDYGFYVTHDLLAEFLKKLDKEKGK